jgi:outer membrane protein OmpA-like peptidoglycan-associated protein
MRLTILLVTSAAALTACGPKPIIAVPVPQAPRTTVILLRDSESGLVGRAHVSTATGMVELTAERDVTTVVGTEAPGPVTTLSEADVRRTFFTPLSTLPPPPRYFTVEFQFSTDTPTDETVSRLSDIVQLVSQRVAPDVGIIGHADTMGAADANHKLGLARAITVRDLLVTAGLDPALIDVTSHGERDLRVQTADEIREADNRRVEIVVR